MERAPLRPVPARPAGPVEPATAVRELAAWLPTLPPLAAHALALVVLAERPRAEVAGALGVSDAELGDLLVSARKELRQTIVVLGGSGWCERAEGLISDRLDGALAERNARRLDVHLRNCPRCVEHERRLVQATDALIGGVGGLRRLPPPTGDELPAPVVETPPAKDSTEASETPAVPVQPAAAYTSDAAPPDAAPRGAAPDAAAPDAAPPGDDQIAAAAEVLVAQRTRGQLATAIVWNSLMALAILLALATIGLTIAGILGAEL